LTVRSPGPIALIAIALASLGPAGAGTLRVEPASIALEGADGRQQVAVSVEEPDGTARDATTSARYSIEPAGIAAVTPSGVVIAKAEGFARLRVESGGRSAEASIAVRGADRARQVGYRVDVAALLSKAGCNTGPCHGNINGKGGFRLSLRGDDPSFDLVAMTRDSFGRRTDLASPARSLIVLKPTGQVPHEGGRRFAPESPEAAALVRWIEGGARDDKATAPKVARLDVFPAVRIAPSPGLAQQLVVTATFTDGSRRDVTREAAYDVNDPTRVSVTAEGRVEARRPFEAVVAVRYLGGRGVSRLAFLPDRPGFAGVEIPRGNPFDSAVFAKLGAHKIRPAGPASDAVFLRRAYTDAIGLLPTPDEARAFLANPAADKRARLVDRLLARPEFADFWALKWADLLRNEEKTMGPKGVWVFGRWLRDQVAADVPLDAFARSLVASTGSNFANPPTSFHRTNRDPMAAAEAVGQVFLGVRLNCARCHNHPFDAWTQDDYFGLAAYFGNVRRKQINNRRLDNLDTHEINGDEVVYVEGPPGIVQPRSGEALAPKAPNGPRPDLRGGDDALASLADWLTRDNPQFARNLANRAWFHLIGRGVVEPVDDFRDSNPPSNPALLDALAAEFRAGGYRLRPLVALIMKSRTYALDSRPDGANADDEINFSHAAVRLLPAEVLIDAVCQVLEQPEPYDQAPRSARAAQMPGARPGGSFLKAFGKPERLLTCECERSDSTTLAQALELINGSSVRLKLVADDNRIGRLIRSGATDRAILEELSLAALGHEFEPGRRSGFLEYVAKGPDRRKAWEDVAWAIVNGKEFLLRH